MKKSDVVIFIIILIFIITYIFIKIFTVKSGNILMEYAKVKSNYISNLIINDSINSILNDINYNNLITYSNNSLDFDNEKINNILFLYTNNIIKNIKSFEKKLNIYFVPMGTIYSLPILTNLGPKIPFKIIILGDTSNEVKTNIKEYGINSSLIEVVLNIHMRIEVIFPFVSDEILLEKNIILDSKVIQGDIPKYYGGFN